jgi:hypothetical protein
MQVQIQMPGFITSQHGHLGTAMNFFAFARNSFYSHRKHWKNVGQHTVFLHRSSGGIHQAEIRKSLINNKIQTPYRDRRHFKTAYS